MRTLIAIIFVGLFLVTLASLTLGQGPPPWDVPGGHDRIRSICKSSRLLQKSGYCQCTMGCENEQYPVRKHEFALEYLQCMSECACDSRETLCVQMRQKHSSLSELACPFLDKACVVPRADLVRKTDPRSIWRAGEALPEDSRTNKVMIDVLVDEGFCEYCKGLQTRVVGCAVCLLLTKPTNV